MVEFDRAEEPAGSRAVIPTKHEASTPKQKPAAGAERSGAFQADKDDLARTMVQRQADFENYRKRIERERQEESRRGVGRISKT